MSYFATTFSTDNLLNKYSALVLVGNEWQITPRTPGGYSKENQNPYLKDFVFKV